MQMAQATAAGVIHTLREEAERLADRLGQVEQEVRALQREHTRMIADKDAKIALLEGEKRQLQALVETYRRALAAYGIDEPALGHYEVSGDPPILKPAAEDAL